MKIDRDSQGWYIFTGESFYYLYSNLEIHKYTGGGGASFPYFKTEAEAKECLRKYNCRNCGHPQKRSCAGCEVYEEMLREFDIKEKMNMRKLKIGDKVNLFDGSYAFGICKGEYGGYNDGCRANKKRNLTVIETDLCSMRDYRNDIKGEYTAVCDILVTDNEGNFWFTQERFVELAELEHTVSFDGKEPVTISDKSYKAIREQFLS